MAKKKRKTWTKATTKRKKKKVATKRARPRPRPMPRMARALDRLEKQAAYDFSILEKQTDLEIAAPVNVEF